MTLNMVNKELYICYSIDELKQKGIDVKNILIAGKIEELARDLIKEYSHDSIVKYNYEHVSLLNGKLICKVSPVDEIDRLLSSNEDSDISIIETAIKVYNINKDNDFALYMVFKTLATESIFLPVNTDRNLLSLSLGDEKEVIALFTGKNRVDINENIQLSEVYLRNCIDVIMKTKKHLVINPFSEKSIQFVIPYDAISRFLIPILQERR